MSQIAKRDELIEYVGTIERNESAPEESLLSPGPDVLYQMHLEYLAPSVPKS